MILTTTAMCNNCTEMNQLESYFIKFAVLHDNLKWRCLHCGHINEDKIIDVTQEYADIIQGVTK